MKIPKKFLTSAGKLFKKSSARKEPTLKMLEDYRKTLGRNSRGNHTQAAKLKPDKYGNRTSLDENKYKINPWRAGETYAPGESSKFKP